MRIPRHALPWTLLFLIVSTLSPLLRAQQRQEKVLYEFCSHDGNDCPDGAQPLYGALVQDSQGNLYGTTRYGGVQDAGVVFELSPPPGGGDGPWTETVLHSFCSAASCQDGKWPWSGVILDSHGNLYGTTSAGGTVTHGVAFKVSPPPGGHGSWTESVIYNFCSVGACRDGSEPQASLIFDSSGNLYGTTSVGGAHRAGMAFRLSPPPGGQGLWTQTILYPFCIIAGCADGLVASPGALSIDPAGNLYGTTQFGGGPSDGGIVYQLSPSGGQYGFWAMNVLHTFFGSIDDGSVPLAGVTRDTHNNLYGTTQQGGRYGGVVYELSPPHGGSGPWTETIIQNFYARDGANSVAPVIFDAAGILYGTAQNGGANGGGLTFELTPTGNGSWTEHALYNFCWPTCTSGNYPFAITLDHIGNIYGTSGGGDWGHGVVYELPWGIPTTTVLATAPNPSDLQQTVTMTATVTSQNGSIPAGTVVFNSDDVEIGSVTLDDAGVAVLTDSNFTPVPHHLVAVYQPSTRWTGSTSNTVMQVVNPWYASTTSVTSSPNPSTIGDVVTFTATVGPPGSPRPSGTVSFTSDGTPISGCTNIPLPYSLQVTCSSSTTPVGMNTIVATYSGNPYWGPSSGSMWQTVNPVPTPLQFLTTTPCRVLDTRPQNGGAGPIHGGTAEDFALPQLGDCNVPANAVAYSLNLTAIPHGPLGYLTVWPTGENRPNVSLLNSPDGRTKANAAILPAGTSGAVSVYASDTTDIALDIDGYFVTSGVQTLEFYTLPPCRVIDTRHPDGPLAGPFLAGLVERDFPVLDSSCIPQNVNAAAYSVNFTAVPHAPGQQLGYLTVWPEGDAKPVVSTLNNPKGTIVANAAIVRAGAGGGVAVYPDQDTDLVVDINGYFAAPGGPNGLSLYALSPCRALDTRQAGDGQPFNGRLTVNVAGGACAPPANAEAYVFNATVVPSGNLSYLTLWPDSEDQPIVSTLNAADGWITSNMAIVPNINGSVDAYAAGVTQLILDISSYFAP
jgi:uncharacterized repeat protein (TIGR03803 family)